MGVTLHTDSGGVIICLKSEGPSRSTNDMLSAYYLVCQGSRHRELRLKRHHYFSLPISVHPTTFTFPSHHSLWPMAISECHHPTETYIWSLFPFLTI